MIKTLQKIFFDIFPTSMTSSMTSSNIEKLMTSFDDVIDPTKNNKNIFHKIQVLSFHFHPESSKSVKNCDLQQFLKKNLFLELMTSSMTSQAQENYQKIFFEEFLCLINMCENFMTLGQQTKKLEGGGQNPPPPCPETYCSNRGGGVIFTPPPMLRT